MFTEFSFEMKKMLRKPRTYVGPAGMALIIAMLMLGLKYDPHAGTAPSSMQNDFLFAGSFVNAAFAAQLLIPLVMLIFLPLFVCMVYGDLLASEAADGTMRVLLTRPVTRGKVLASKYAVGALYTVILTIGSGAAVYLAGWAVLGRGQLVSMSSGFWVFTEQEALVRLAAAYVLLAAVMLAVGSIAFAISTFLSNSNGAIGGAMGLLIGFTILGQFQFFSPLRPYMFTTYGDPEALNRLFTSNLDVSHLAASIGVMAIYSAACAVIGLVIFRRKDVLS